MPATTSDGLCPKCQRPKDHRHCSGCGCRLAKGETPKHSDDCSLVTEVLKRKGQMCPTCRRVLACGAPCPDHGHSKPPILGEEG